MVLCAILYHHALYKNTLTHYLLVHIGLFTGINKSISHTKWSLEAFGSSKNAMITLRLPILADSSIVCEKT